MAARMDSTETLCPSVEWSAVKNAMTIFNSRDNHMGPCIAFLSREFTGTS